MEYYLTIKMIHILAAVIVTGTGIGIAFFMFMASRTNNIQAIAITTKHVVLADWIFTLPAVLVQFITGMMLFYLGNYSYSSTWFLVVMSLFVFIGTCWLPVIYLQYRLKYYANNAITEGVLDTSFQKTMRIWTALGVPAFISLVIIFWLMIFKPLPMS